MRLALTTASSLLLTAIAFAQGPSTPIANAKDEAIPQFRDGRKLILRHLRIIDGTGAPAKEDQAIVIDGGKILAIGSNREIEDTQNALSVNLEGRTVLPGFVMLHEHLFTNDPGGGRTGAPTHPQPFSFPRLYLAFGVTTLRTAGTDFPYMDFNLKQRIEAGLIPGPEIHLTGPYFSGEGDPFLGAKIMRSTEEARRAVRYWAAEGFTSFKAYQWIPKDILAAVIDEAHRLKLPVTAHLNSVTCQEAAELGIDNIEHGCPTVYNLEPSDPEAQATLRKLVDKKVVLTLTPTNARKPLADSTLELLDPSARQRYSKTFATPASSAPSGFRDSHYAHFALAFVKAGGRVVLGSDAGAASLIAGIADQEALENLVSIGFEPLDAIKIATLNGAEFLGIQNRTGSIEVGKEADLLIVHGNPAEHIENIANLEMVFTNGVAYDPKALLAKVKGQVGWK
jgi:imidazolonepropionase-like amidohydrolase